LSAMRLSHKCNLELMLTHSAGEIGGQLSMINFFVAYLMRLTDAFGKIFAAADS
jgi:hypothetical protein